jgi:hypothetical protein
LKNKLRKLRILRKTRGRGEGESEYFMIFLFITFGGGKYKRGYF